MFATVPRLLDVFALPKLIWPDKVSDVLSSDLLEMVCYNILQLCNYHTV